MSNRRGLSIRTATPADAPGLAELLEAAGQTIPSATLAERLEILARTPGTALLALEWGPPSGVVLLHWFHTLHAARPTAQIDLLLVGPDDRRRGLGRLLVKAAAQAARVAGCGTLDLTSTASQRELHAFCQATGFTLSGPRFTRVLRKGAASIDTGRA